MGTHFETIVAFGENTSMPHAVPTHRKLQSGDIIQFDFGAKYKDYCSDFSRVVFIDEMKDEYKEVYDFVIEQQQKIVEEFKDGANVKNVIKALACQYYAPLVIKYIFQK